MWVRVSALSSSPAFHSPPIPPAPGAGEAGQRRVFTLRAAAGSVPRCAPGRWAGWPPPCPRPPCPRPPSSPAEGFPGLGG